MVTRDFVLFFFSNRSDIKGLRIINIIMTTYNLVLTRQQRFVKLKLTYVLIGFPGIFSEFAVFSSQRVIIKFKHSKDFG